MMHRAISSGVEGDRRRTPVVKQRALKDVRKPIAQLILTLAHPNGAGLLTTMSLAISAVAVT